MYEISTARPWERRVGRELFQDKYVQYLNNIEEDGIEPEVFEFSLGTRNGAAILMGRTLFKFLWKYDLVSVDKHFEIDEFQIVVRLSSDTTDAAQMLSVLLKMDRLFTVDQRPRPAAFATPFTKGTWLNVIKLDGRFSAARHKLVNCPGCGEPWTEQGLTAHKASCQQYQQLLQQ